MNKTQLRQTSAGSRLNNTESSLNNKYSSNQKSKPNPQDEIKTSNPNDPLIKIMTFDNGNSVKDCKAILYSIKQQSSEDKQKLNIFYQQDSLQLLDSLQINNISINNFVIQKLRKQIDNKIKKIKIKNNHQTYQNYNKLMKHSLRQNQKIKFITQTNKIHQSQSNSNQHHNNNSKNHLFKLKHKQFITNSTPSNITILDQIITEKRNLLTIENSSKLNKQQQNLQSIMKNRTICQKILEQALMFERYYDILKKQKNKLLDHNKAQSSFRMKTQPSNKQIQKRNKFYKPIVKSLKNPNTIMKFNIRQNGLCVNPKHLRLNQKLSKSLSNFQSQQDYKRNKYMVKLKRDQYLKQINRINQQFVQKRNHKNNILINSLLSFIRSNSSTNDMENKIIKYEPDSNSNNNQKIKCMSGSALTKILRKLFLLYSFRKTQQSGSQHQSVISHQNLIVFLQNFQIDANKIIHKNQKIKEIINKQSIDQFQFIQFIHLLSTVQSFHFDDSDQIEGLIYTNINKWVASKILNQRFQNFLALQQEQIIKRDLKKQLQKLRKLNRFQDKMVKVVQIFVQDEKINKIIVPTLFDDFDYVLESLWFMKIYPTYINKRTIRFYFEYLQAQKYSQMLSQLGLIIKRKQFTILQNIIWLIIAKISKQEMIDCPKQVQKQQGQNKVKTLDQIFSHKFKVILKNINHIIEAKNYAKHGQQS